ncbi:hypothetical protein [Bacillus toyonensis]|uniref:hypothetical protein n=1 Tax=Bacillus toyonensis TaxID=155322 RepID=UPI000BF31690|nr:hypothetical protein [Bacillus toyonensis]PGF05261.1 hypothetical protein COM61_02285 [Bacillus toyonensis]
MNKQEITEELHVVEEDLIKVKLGLNKVDKYVEKLEDIQEELGHLVEYLNCRLPKGTLWAVSETEADYQELFTLSIITIDRTLQDFLDSLVENFEGKEDIKELLVKTTIGIRKIMYKHSDLKPVNYALTNASKCLKLSSSDIEEDKVQTYKKEFTDLVSLARRENQNYDNTQYKNVEEEILSRTDYLSFDMKHYLLSKVEGEDKEKLDWSLSLMREVSLFLHAVLSK